MATTPRLKKPRAFLFPTIGAQHQARLRDHLMLPSKIRWVDRCSQIRFRILGYDRPCLESFTRWRASDGDGRRGRRAHWHGLFLLAAHQRVSEPAWMNLRQECEVRPAGYRKNKRDGGQTRMPWNAV
jgi:hypothetical protein